MAINRWRGEVMRVTRTAYGLRVALGALGMQVDDAWIAVVHERIKDDVETVAVGGKASVNAPALAISREDAVRLLRATGSSERQPSEALCSLVDRLEVFVEEPAR